MEQESLTFDARYGQVSFMTNGYPTMEQVANLANAARLLGIPGGASVTSLRIVGHGEQVEVDVSWRVE